MEIQEHLLGKLTSQIDTAKPGSKCYGAIYVNERRPARIGWRFVRYRTVSSKDERRLPDPRSAPEATRLGAQLAGTSAEHDGKSCFRILTAALLRAADRGARVRILIDDGDRFAGDEQIMALDGHPSIALRVFNSFVYLGHLTLLRGTEFLFNLQRLDYRMHNKLLIADNVIGLVGGRNIGNQYLQMDPESRFAAIARHRHRRPQQQQNRSRPLPPPAPLHLWRVRADAFGDILLHGSGLRP